MTSAGKVLAGLVLASVALAGCGGGDDTSDCDPIAATLVSRIVVTPSSVTLADGESVQLTAVAYSCNGTQVATPTMTWQSADATTISVSGTGMAVAVNEGGPVAVTAVAQGKQGSARILVAPRTVASVRVEPSAANIAVGRVSALVARAYDAQGGELPGRSAVWSSSDAGVASVSAEGAITGVSVGGPVTISAMIEGKEGTARITVVTAAVSGIGVTPPTSTISVGATVQLQAVLRDDQGSVLTGRAVLWSTSDAARATVSSSGLVTGLAPGGPVTMVATSEGRSGSAQVTVNPLPIGIATAGLPSATVGIAYNQSTSATGGVTPYVWTLSGGTLPSGIALGASGVLSGTPTASGSFAFTLRVTDAASQTATRALTIQVIAGLSITTTSVPTANTGASYSQQLVATGGTAPYSWTIASGTPPPGLNLNSAGILSGTPTTAGSSTFNVQVSDGASRTDTQALTVTVNSSLSIGTTSLPGGTTGTNYSQQLVAAGGASAYTWSLTSGTLPDGLSLSSAGVLSGTPTTPGSSGFTVRVADAGGGSATRALILSIVAPVGITTQMLPPATSGTAYSQALAASGGSAPYTWSLAAGTLPDGLTLSPVGVLSGTPTIAGDYSFTVQVTDAASRIAAQALSVTVAAGEAAQIIWLQQPTNTDVNAAISPAPRVRVQDRAGNVVNVTGMVSVRIARPPKAAFTASSVTSVATVAGVGTFSSLVIGRGEKSVRLRASIGSLNSPESANFEVK
jgi:hypothetical protein